MVSKTRFDLVVGVLGLVVGAFLIFNQFSLTSALPFMRLLFGIALIFSGSTVIAFRWRNGWMWVSGFALFSGTFVFAGLVMGPTLDSIDLMFAVSFLVVAFIAFFGTTFQPHHRISC
jgi:hypothetical protein